MSIPDFQTLMHPLLELHADGHEETQGDLRDALAIRLGLTEDELAERIPSGTTTVFANRVAWASTHMTQAGLLAKPRRGISCITDRGQAVLKNHPHRIDMSVLEQFSEYNDFRQRSSGRRRVTQPESQTAVVTSNQTPDEEIEVAYQEIRDAVVDDLLARLVDRDGRFFEEVVLDVLVALGYGGSERKWAVRVGRSGDGGIDGVIREDALGLDAI